MKYLKPTLHLAHDRPARFARAIRRTLCGLMLVLLVGCSSARADAGPASLQDVLNSPMVQVSDTSDVEAGREGMPLPWGSRVVTDQDSLATISFAHRAVIRLWSGTSVILESPTENASIRIALDQGHISVNLAGFISELQTPLGHVHLTGHAAVIYDPGASADLSDDVLSLRCYTGPCQIESGAFTTSLNSLERMDLSQLGVDVRQTSLSIIELRQYIADNPGSSGVIGTLTAMPSLTATPTTTESPTPTQPTATSTWTPTSSSTPTTTPEPTRTPTLPAPTIPPVIELTATSTPSETAPVLPRDNPPPVPTTTMQPTNTPIPSDTPVASLSPDGLSRWREAVTDLPCSCS